MKKILILVILTKFYVFNAIANNIKIDHEISITYMCKFEKIIKKNEEFNYKVFKENEIEISDLKNFEIISKKPNHLKIKGLSVFFEASNNLDVKIVSNEVVLFKGFDNDKNYSESAIINRKSGELVHEVTRDLKSEVFKKDISFYKCEEFKKNI